MNETDTINLSKQKHRLPPSCTHLHWQTSYLFSAEYILFASCINECLPEIRSACIKFYRLTRQML